MFNGHQTKYPLMLPYPTAAAGFFPHFFQSALDPSTANATSAAPSNPPSHDFSSDSLY